MREKDVIERASDRAGRNFKHLIVEECDRETKIEILVVREDDNAEPLLPSSTTERRSDLLVNERGGLTDRNDSRKNVYPHIGMYRNLSTIVWQCGRGIYGSVQCDVREI